MVGLGGLHAPIVDVETEAPLGALREVPGPATSLRMVEPDAREHHLRERREDVEYEVLGACAHELVDEHAHLVAHAGRMRVMRSSTDADDDDRVEASRKRQGGKQDHRKPC